MRKNSAEFRRDAKRGSVRSISTSANPRPMARSRAASAWRLRSDMDSSAARSAHNRGRSGWIAAAISSDVAARRHSFFASRELECRRCLRACRCPSNPAHATHGSRTRDSRPERATPISNLETRSGIVLESVVTEVRAKGVRMRVIALLTILVPHAAVFQAKEPKNMTHTSVSRVVRVSAAIR